MACSFAKNMGLYGERIGALHVLTSDNDSASATLSQLKIIARVLYSNPPQFGAMVAHRVMTDSNLRSLWETELKQMSGRIQKMRMELRRLLEEKLPGTSWKHVTDQIGMFSYTGTHIHTYIHTSFLLNGTGPKFILFILFSLFLFTLENPLLTF